MGDLGELAGRDIRLMDKITDSKELAARVGYLYGSD
jgi:hypothetical protein